ncbi:AHH domain-containing protein [Corallococcus sp. AB030]|uniref:AHH domain-containing protein n=1 Tax=Corallococcus sp. AB030 TaxID=2316716 RepID=UPI0034CD30C7
MASGWVRRRRWSPLPCPPRALSPWCWRRTRWPCLLGDEKSPVASGADAGGHEHHIASNKWWSATNRGGPWSPQFQKIFDKAGMSLDDPANKVRVPGHRGPHPEAYHQWVLRSLSRATNQCRSMAQCRALLTDELRRLASQITRKESIMNRWVTGLE